MKEPPSTGGYMDPFVSKTDSYEKCAYIFYNPPQGENHCDDEYSCLQEIKFTEFLEYHRPLGTTDLTYHVDYTAGQAV